jgi:hypothetical protein
VTGNLGGAGNPNYLRMTNVRYLPDIRSRGQSTAGRER